MMDSKVFRIPMSSPDDVSGLKSLFDAGDLHPEEVVAILGKTEGNGCVNDFTRGFSTMAFRLLLSEYLQISTDEVDKKVAFVMSGGTEGVMTPHVTVFARSKASTTSKLDTGLSIGVAFTREFAPEEIGTMVQVREVAKSVQNAMADAKIDGPQDVHFVQIKCPLLTSDRIRSAEERGMQVAVTDTYKSMGYSRAAAALGVALATGEIEETQLADDKIANDWSLYSSVASTSAGVELMNCEIIVMGNSPSSASDLRIGHSVMADSIDLAGVLDALRSAGLNFEYLPSSEQLQQIVNVFAKAEADPTGIVRGRRNTMLTDSDINHTRHARAVVGGVIASIIGDPMVYVSGGAEHQGPAGGGPIAVIVRK